MKELSIEEKAKRYDEALEKARQLCAYPTTKPFISDLQDIFHELKESDDERIRKALIWHLTKIDNETPLGAYHRIDGIEISDMLVWLEKQGEQKPANKVKPEFHKGDWVVVSTTKGDRVVQIDSVEYFKDGYPSYFTTDGRWFGNGTKARLLTDKDVETITLPKSKIILNKIKSWSEEDETGLTNTIIMLKEGASLHFNKKDITKAVDWLKSLKDRVQPKVEWSEEDEYHKRQILRILKDNGCSRTLQEKTEKWIEERLKSLRPQNTWKPSDEQMNVIEAVINNRSFQRRHLDSLYADLKKLKA